MRTARFDLALERLRPSDWKKFEDLASKFLAPDLPGLRTVASSSGDKGRDAELFNPEGNERVMLQYSVAQEWNSKIKNTAKRVHEQFPNATVLIYVTNHFIGAKADALKAEIRERFNLHLDIRDRTWFLERLHVDRAREQAAEELAEQIVDPYLASAEVVKTKAVALTTLEARAAFVHLALQWEDDTREKGLTKLSFEALVRAVLRGTTPDNRLHRDVIREGIRKLLPSHPREVIGDQTDAAIGRLTKRSVRHYEKDDEFCLTHEERIRLSDRMAEVEESDRRFRSDIEDLVRRKAAQAELRVADFDDLTTRTRRVLEKFLLGRGEEFASAVITGQMRALNLSRDVADLIARDVAEVEDKSELGGNLAGLVMDCIEETLFVPTEAMRLRIRTLADGYTLFAFLQETPDVQSALVKLFGHGELWLDTSIVLPILAEDLLDPAERRYSTMLGAARECGMTLRITDGVLEEMNTHIERCLYCWRTHARDWEGRLPFLFSVYTHSGLPLPDFWRWIEQFRGASRPADDIVTYLGEFGVELGSLDGDMRRTDDRIRHEVQEIWHEAHGRRRAWGARQLDAISLGRLVSHDVENYLGVVGRRAGERTAAFGYTTWWITLDRTAFEVREELGRRLGQRPPDSPVLSADFLLNYLVFGPVRNLISRGTVSKMPVAIDPKFSDFLPKELLELADTVRASSVGLPERLIRRRVRDALDAAKWRKGLITAGGIAEASKHTLDALEGQ